MSYYLEKPADLKDIIGLALRRSFGAKECCKQAVRIPILEDNVEGQSGGTWVLRERAITWNHGWESK